MKKKFETPELVPIMLKITENIAASSEVSGLVTFHTTYDEIQGVQVYVNSGIPCKPEDNTTLIMLELIDKGYRNCIKI